MSAYDLDQDELLGDAIVALDSAAELLELASAVMMANGFLTAGGMAVALYAQLCAVGDNMEELTGMEETDDIEAVKVRASQFIKGFLELQKKKAERKAQEMEEQDSGF